MSGLPIPKNADLAAEYTGQPELFAMADVDRDTVSAARVFLHTGNTTARNAERAALIVAAASLGWSQRRIAQELGHSRNTVKAVLQLAEKAGKLEPVKERVLAAAADAIHSDIELGNDLADDVRSGNANEKDLAALASLRRATWVGAGILADKGAAPAAAGAGLTVHVGPGSVVQVVQDYATRLKQLAAGPEMESGVEAAKAQQITDIGGQVMQAVMQAAPESAAAASGALPADANGADRGAGGVGAEPGRGEGDGNG